MNSGRIEQEGAPRQIYEQPASEFVAAFVGQSNLFGGRVLRAKHGLIEVRTDDNLIIRAAAYTSVVSLQTGDEVLLSVRPEAMEVRATSGSSSANQLTGQVAASAYQGTLIEYEVRLLGRTLKTYTVNPKGKTAFSARSRSHRDFCRRRCCACAQSLIPIQRIWKMSFQSFSYFGNSLMSSMVSI
jgi:spermidine/putrescine transport system ATP-binding protein